VYCKWGEEETFIRRQRVHKSFEKVWKRKGGDETKEEEM
jgi:hypothetical protein